MVRGINTQVQVEVLTNEKYIAAGTDFERYIYDLETQINMLSSQADKWDYLNC